MADLEPAAEAGPSPDGEELEAATDGLEAPGASEAGPDGTHDCAPVDRRRGGLRWRRWMSLLVVVAVLVGGVLAGLAKAESMVRARLDQEVRRALPGLSPDAVVDLGDGYLLPQVLDGQVEDLSLRASSLRLSLAGERALEGLPETVSLQDLSVHVQHLEVRSPHKVAALRVGGTLSWEEVTVLAGAYLEANSDSLPGGQAPQITVGPGQEGRLRATTSVLGTQVSVEAETSLNESGDLVLTLSEVSAGQGLLSGSLGGDDGADLLELAGVPATVTVLRSQDLPAGLRLVGAAPSEAGMVLGLEGQDLEMDALR